MEKKEEKKEELKVALAKSKKSLIIGGVIVGILLKIGRASCRERV